MVGILMVIIYLLICLPQFGERKREKEYCKQKIEEYGMKGDQEMANMYIERLTRMK